MANTQTKKPLTAGGAKKSAQGAVRRRKRKKSRAPIVLLVLVLLAAGVILAIHFLSDDFELENDEDPVATLTLSNGEEIVVELFPAYAPRTVDRFIALAGSGAYDGKGFDWIYAGEYVNRPSLGHERWINNCFVVLPGS